MKKSLSGYTSKVKSAVRNRVYIGKTRLKNLNFLLRVCVAANFIRWGLSSRATRHTLHEIMRSRLVTSK